MSWSILMVLGAGIAFVLLLVVVIVAVLFIARGRRK